MAEHFWLGMLVVLLSGVLNGVFAVPMKYSRSWRWENTWLGFTALGLVIVPWLLALGFVPHLAQVYSSVSHRALFYPLLFGFLWGIAQVTFGVGIKMVGVALTFAVVSGLSSLSGSLVPILWFDPADLFRPRGLLLLLSIPFLLVGLAFYGVAGRRREKEQTTLAASDIGKQAGFAAGLAICIFTGIFGANFNIGFAFAGDIARASREAGASPIASTFAVWALVLTAGFIPNLLYCGYLLLHNGTWSLYFASGSAREALLSFTMGISWISAIISYGIGATLVGRYGTSIGFMLFIASSILFANVFGFLTAEWKGTSARTLKILLAAVAFILLAVVVLNLGGLF